MRDRLQQQECLICSREILARGLGEIRRQWEINGISLEANQFGFHKPDESAVVPVAVARASQSVLKVVIFSSAPWEEIWLSRTDLSEQLGAAIVKGGRFNWWAQVLAVNLAACEKSGASMCHIPNIKTAETGSAFLVGEGGRRLWSSNHVFIGKIRSMLRASAFLGERDLVDRRSAVPLYLFDQDGQPVATPYDNSAHILVAPKITRGEILSEDMIKIELDHSLHRPGLRFATERALPTTRIYHLGYGNCTGCATQYSSFQDWNIRGTRYPYPDSPGDELRVTIGAVFEASTVLISYSDGIYGMSGGPALNERGEVLGINLGVQVALLGTDIRGDQEDPTDKILHLFAAAIPEFDFSDNYVMTADAH